MRLRALSWVCGLVLIGVAVMAYSSLRPRGMGMEARTAPLATPVGITLRSTPRQGPGTGAGGSMAMNFADERGALLYRFDKGAEPGRPGCAGDCRAVWRPATAQIEAGSGDWSVVTAPDGRRQWALGGAPLYVRAPDAPPAADTGDAPWHGVTFDPQTAYALPLGIASRDLPNGGGQAFTDEMGMTLYEASSTDGIPAIGRWKPVPAPEIAHRFGDFDVIARADGIRQWSYGGRPLYRFDGDSQPDDASGAGVDARIQVALYRRYFMPVSVVVRHTPALGDILTTQDGMTLYARDRFIDADGHNFRTDHGPESAGRAMGVTSCEGECTKIWRPLIAPGDASASGYWDVFVRPDGVRQWAYKGYALYSFSGDLRAGQINGNESYTLMPLGRDDPYAGVLAASRPGLGVGAMFWRAATP